MKIRYLDCLLFCLSVCLSCDKQPKEEPLQPKTTILSYEETIDLDSLYPELPRNFQYNEETGYYISFGHLEWTHPWSCGPAFIPAQSSAFTTRADRVDQEDFSGWYDRHTSYAVLEDIQLPENASNLTGGDCPSMFKLHISLDEDVPYRKVTLEDFSIQFPYWFNAELADAVYGSIPTLEVTAEGVDLPVRLYSIQEPVQFFDAEGRRDYSLELIFDARVTASPEDALHPVSDVPSVLGFRFSFELEQINFTRCFLDFPDISFVEMTFTWNPAELPSFLCGKNTAVTLTQPRILFEYWTDFPFSESHLEATALCGDHEASFSVWDNAKYLMLPQEDGWYREGIINRGVKSLGTVLCGPFPDGTLKPSLTFKPVSLEDCVVAPGREYRMTSKVDWTVPLAFTGEMESEGCPTPPLKLDGETLGAPGHSRHRITQVLVNNLPFDCRVTPVFTMEGKEPVRLDSFILNRQNQQAEFTYEFTPSEDSWRATLHYLVSPFRGQDAFLKKTDTFVIWSTKFTANAQ